MFFALCPDTGVGEQLHRLGEKLAARHGGRAMRRETLHLTLAFVGHVASGRLSELQAMAAEVSGPPAAPVTLPLCLDRLGFWPHNRILWAGTAAVPSGLDDLAASLAGRLRSMGLPVAAGSPFVPHVTLVRKAADGPDAAECAALSVAPLPWSCREFALLQSLPTTTGSRYVPLARWPLPGP